MKKNSSNRRLIFFAAIAVGLMLSGIGCSTFNRDWKAAAQAAQPPDGLQGRWEGIWLSDHNGHTDRLRCLITRQDDGQYAARFYAWYKKVFTFSYTVPLVVEPAGDFYKFNGAANLGWLAGGLYQYEGKAGDTNFFSTYRCKYDYGTFQMARPASEN